MSTLLPTPEAPMMNSTSPSRTSKLTSSKTALGPKDFLMCLNSIRTRPSLASRHDLGVLDPVELGVLRVEERVARGLDRALRQTVAVALVDRVHDLHAGQD